MTPEALQHLVQEIVRKATGLKDRHTSEKGAPVNYACVFSQSREEYEKMAEAARRMGKVVKETATGPVFLVRPLETVSGSLRLLKIRVPDKTRPERGDADFTVKGYPSFRDRCLRQKGFRLVVREGFEMVELMEPGCEVRAYFSHPTLGEMLGIR